MVELLWKTVRLDEAWAVARLASGATVISLCSERLWRSIDLISISHDVCVHRPCRGGFNPT